MLVVVECVGSQLAKITCNATDGKIHLCKFICCICIFLTINRDVALITVMSFDKLHTLHKHTSRTAARIIDFTTIRFDDFGYKIYDTLWRIIFSFTFAFSYSELGKEIFINATDKVVLRIFESVDFIYFVK